MTPTPDAYVRQDAVRLVLASLVHAGIIKLTPAFQGTTDDFCKATVASALAWEGLL